MYVKTDTILDEILAHKITEVEAAEAKTSLKKLLDKIKTAPPPRDMAAALKKDTVALIAEVKKASPSKAILVEDFDPEALGRLYANHGASAISVLTDEKFFQGHLDHMTQVRRIVPVPVLRKDFIITAYQIYEARAAGADAILLIVAALDDAQLADLHTLTLELGMCPLVEVHNEVEMERAIKIQPLLIGVNNRDLKTFTVDLKTTERLATFIPDDVILIAESGIRNSTDVKHMGQFGARAVLVGEHLVQSDHIAQCVRDFSNQPYN